MLMLYLAAIEMDADKLKFEVIYKEYRALMFYVANQILKNEQDAEDVVHQAFLNVIEILDKIEAAKCPKTKSLLVIIVKRKAIDLYRRQRQRAILPIDEENGDISGPSEIEGLLEQVDFARAMATTIMSPCCRSAGEKFPLRHPAKGMFMKIPERTAWR